MAARPIENCLACSKAQALDAPCFERKSEEIFLAFFWD
jgi:hypothetical protein